MRQLLARGWMHNRARLVVGSFLTKNLHLDYRLGEAHFMRYLLCGDKAQNNGNWQWVASVGVDPAPAFSACSIPSANRSASIPTASTSGVGCPSWLACPTRSWPSRGL
jgi:deoxyribodipyrimidine photo-lyase